MTIYALKVYSNIEIIKRILVLLYLLKIFYNNPNLSYLMKTRFTIEIVFRRCFWKAKNCLSCGSDYCFERKINRGKTMKIVWTAEDGLINDILIQYFDNKKSLGENMDIQVNSKTKGIHRTFVMQTIWWWKSIILSGCQLVNLSHYVTFVDTWLSTCDYVYQLIYV